MGGSKRRFPPIVPAGEPARRARSRVRDDATFPVAPPRSEVPADYAAALVEIKRRIQEERLHVVLTANAAMVLLYWDIGRMILERQDRAGWGAKVIDRLAADLRDAFPDMKGFSPRNLKYMRALAWRGGAGNRARGSCTIPGTTTSPSGKLDDPAERLWYARQAMEQGWSHNILLLQIGPRARAPRQENRESRGDWERRRAIAVNPKEVAWRVSGASARSAMCDAGLLNYDRSIRIPVARTTSSTTASR